MFTFKFKQGFACDIEKTMKSYVNSNYDPESYKKIEPFIQEFVQNRNVLIKVTESDRSFENLKMYRDTSVNYLIMINMLKNKLNFGKDQYSLKIDFAWKDTLTDEKFISNSIHFEYFSVMFNLGIVYYEMGKAYYFSEEDLKLKDGVKYFQTAAWIFDRIKEEYQLYVQALNIQPDLQMSYMSFLSVICLAHAQTLVFFIAEKKNMDLELRAQLCMGVYDLYSSALNLANDSLKKRVSDIIRSLLNFKRNYFCAIAFLKMKDHCDIAFKKTGEHYGKQITYVKMAVASLGNAVKETGKFSGTELEKAQTLKGDLEKLHADMIKKNNNMYYDPVPDIGSMPKIEKIVRVNPTSSMEDLTKPKDARNALDDLVPKEAKVMVENYKKQLNEFISEYLDKQENDVKIQNFLHELNLPYSLDSAISSEISDALWKRISEVQQKGGSLFLTNQISSLSGRTEEVARRLSDLEVVLFSEKSEDDRLRLLYGNRWTRQASDALNKYYIETLKDFKNKLEIAKNCDIQIKNTVMDSLKNFELLALSRDALNKRIPVKTDGTALKSCEEAVNLRKDLDELESTKEKIIAIIEDVFNTLNEDNVIPQFIQVLQKKTTEKQILVENKPRYEEKLKQLDSLSEKVNELKKSIITKNEIFSKIKNDQFKPNPENEKFFKAIEDNIGLYNMRATSVQQGIVFYTDFFKRIEDLNSGIKDYVLSRDLEKQDLMNAIQSGTNHQSAFNNADFSFLNPIMNVVTNMRYQFRYDNQNPNNANNNNQNKGSNWNPYNQ